MIRDNQNKTNVNGHRFRSRRIHTEDSNISKDTSNDGIIELTNIIDPNSQDYIDEIKNEDSTCESTC